MYYGLKPLPIFFTSETATFTEPSIILHENNHQSKEIMKLTTVKYLGAIILTAQTKVGLPQEFTAPLEKSPVQMSVYYPVTTQGANTVNYHYNFSFNLFTGRVGAVTGVEFGGLFNRVEDKVNGVQFAGLTNTTKSTTGIQFSGISNFANDVLGLQFGGIANLSEFANGIQFAGITNLTDSVKGIQFGGIANISKSVTGMQFAGITNLAEKNNGFQFAGIYNGTDEISGYQFAGIANVSNQVKGGSFGGVFNRTGTLTGVQFGVVNVIDTIDSGVSIALISIVKKNFYDEWALTFADYQNVGISYKLGMQKFYTIYSVGVNFIEDKLWVFGVGFGHRRALGKKIDFQPEIVSYNYHSENFKNYRNTWANHVKFGFIYNLSPKLGIVVAPGIYHLMFEHKDGLEDVKVNSNSFHFSYNDNYQRNNIGIAVSVGLIMR